MLCKFCDSIDLDQLATAQGYKHHASCGDLIASANNGCESCCLILSTQWTLYGGDIATRCDVGDVDTQIIARVVHQKAGEYHSIRYGQEARWNDSRMQDPPIRNAFLWTFLVIAANPNSPAEEFLKLKVLSTRLLRNRLNLASKWLINCIDCHEFCSQHPVAPVRPSRVIDVGPPDGCQEPFLHTSTPDLQQWVSLSHCWGASQPLRTTKASLPLYQQSLPLNCLPQLFRDAVTIVRSMNYRYLWIDSLCIIQDSKEDWQMELSKMGDIYKYCVFMISAEFCDDHTQSIFSLPPQRKYVYQKCQRSEWNCKDNMATYHKSNEEAERLAHGVLRTRAWAFQEDILSPRTLKWTKEQLVWECRTTIFSEEFPIIENPSTRHVSAFLGHSYKSICLPASRYRLVDTGSLAQSSSTQARDPTVLWYLIVLEFCHRQISFSKDRLPAISGIAKEIARLTGFHYRAGLWLEDFHNALLWKTDGSGTAREDYTGPTWSWASMCGSSFESPAGLVGLGPEERTTTPICEIVSIDINSSGQDEFGPVTSGVLQMKGPCIKLSEYDKNSVIVRDYINPQTRGDSVVPKEYLMQEGFCYLLFDCIPTGSSPLDEAGLILLEIVWYSFPNSNSKEDLNSQEIVSSGRTRHVAYYPGKAWGLILKPTDDGSGNFQRVGVARISHDSVEGWETRLITII